MRSGSDKLIQALQGSFNCWWTADVFQDGNRVFQDLPLSSVSLTEDATAMVQYTGTLSFAYQDPAGKSIAPKGIADALSPFGTQIALSLIVRVGSFSERVQMGTYLVSSTPQISTNWAMFQGQKASRGDVIQVQIADLFARTQKNQFDSPSAPTSLLSCWAEIQRLTGLPVTRTIADVAIPNATTYLTDRLSAVYAIATAMNAVPYVAVDGSVSARPNVWPAPVDTIRGGDGGALISAPRSMDASKVYNVLVVRDQSGNVLASAEVLSGPLRSRNSDGSLSPYGRVPYYYSSPYITNPTQAQAYANANLASISTLRGMVVPVTEKINPLRDLGDVVTVQRVASGVVVETFAGRVQQIQRSGKTQVTTLAVNQ